MPMTDIEKQVLGVLEELDAAVKSTRAGQRKPELPGLFARLEALERELPGNCERNLRHYLRNKSYEKARLLLQGRDAENARGAC